MLVFSIIKAEHFFLFCCFPQSFLKGSFTTFPDGKDVWKMAGSWSSISTVIPFLVHNLNVVFYTVTVQYMLTPCISKGMNSTTPSPSSTDGLCHRIKMLDNNFEVNVFFFFLFSASEHEIWDLCPTRKKKNRIGFYFGLALRIFFRATTPICI